MPSITILKRATGKGHLTSADEANDTVAISGLVRTAAAAASLYTDAFTTSITIGSTGTPTTIGDNLTISGELRGPSDGTGIVVGQAPAGASTGSALQVVSVTTAQKGQLVAANGMIILDSDLSQLQGRIGAAWVDLGAGASGGDVVGPASATDNAICRFDLSTGKLIQNSGVTISDSNEVRHAGTVEWDKGVDLASAATLTLGVDGNYFDVTGTTSITAISAKAIGSRILLQFDAALTVTHNATTLILAQGTNFVTAAGNHLELVCYDGTNWRELSRSVGDPSTIATATADTTTTSTTDVLVNSMTITPIAGDYLVWFTSSMGTDTQTTTFPSIYSGGTQVAPSEVYRFLRSGRDSPFSCIAKVTVNGSQAIEGRWRTGAGTVTMHQRSLMILKVA